MPYGSREAQRAFHRNWMSQRRRDWFAGKVCYKCGSMFDLELHHLDPSKKVTHRIWSWSEKRRAEELAKCVACCEECHKEESARQAWKPLRHGTNRGYKRGCRCDECRKAVVAYNRACRLRKRSGPPPTRTGNLVGVIDAI